MILKFNHKILVLLRQFQNTEGSNLPSVKVQKVKIVEILNW